MPATRRFQSTELDVNGNGDPKAVPDNLSGDSEQIMLSNELTNELSNELSNDELGMVLIECKKPLSMAPIERVRSTSATLRRIENMQRLIGELSVHEMLADEIAWFLKFSPSGARKYIRDLRDAGVIELARYIEGTATYLGKAVYQLSPDPERVRTFLAAIVQPKRDGVVARKDRMGQRDQSLSGSGRHFHILADDTHYAIRVNRGPVTRDPLVAALFGSAPSQQKDE